MLYKVADSLLLLYFIASGITSIPKNECNISFTENLQIKTLIVLSLNNLLTAVFFFHREHVIPMNNADYDEVENEDNRMNIVPCRFVLTKNLHYATV